MQINVTVENADLGSTVPQPYGEDITLGSLVAQEVASEFKQTEGWDGIRKRFQNLRDEEIRAQVAPIIAEAIHTPVVRTNVYGEPTGESTTLRELVVKEAREALTRREDRYGRDNTTNLQKVIRAEVQAAFVKEVAAVVKEVRAQVVAEIGETARDQITKASMEALKSR